MSNSPFLKEGRKERPHSFITAIMLCVSCECVTRVPATVRASRVSNDLVSRKHGSKKYIQSHELTSIEFLAAFLHTSQA